MTSLLIGTFQFPSLFLLPVPPFPPTGWQTMTKGQIQLPPLLVNKVLLEHCQVIYLCVVNSSLHALMEKQ